MFISIVSDTLTAVVKSIKLKPNSKFRKNNKKKKYSILLGFVIHTQHIYAYMCTLL